MSIKLGQNIQSIGVQRQLDISSQKLATVYERLSSGQRINRAADDAAGLAIADQLNASSRVYTQALRNANDGQSALSIADSAYGALSDITIRLRELSEQSATGTFSATQRESLDNEAQALKDEFERITATTSFNGISLLDGSLAEGMRLQVGIGVEGSILVDFGGSASLTGGVVGTGTFEARTTISTGSDPWSVNVADLNDDGFLDLMSADRNSNTVSIHLGNGDGTFATRTTLLTGSRPFSVTAEDLNDDGNLDIVVADTSGTTFSIFISNGNGTFAARTTAGIAPDSVAVADLNEDGNLDLISSGTVNIHLGNGDGTFAAATSVAQFANGVTTGDLDGDDNLDIIVADAGTNRLGIILGNGDGTFAAITTFTTGALPQFVIASDLNGDGHLDLVSSDLSGSTLSLFIGNGDATFAARTTLFVGAPQEVTARDLNGDGALDLIAAESGFGTIAIFLGNGDGTFSSRSTLMAGTPSSIATGDLDGDGALDIISGERDGTNSLSVFFGIAETSSSITGGAAIALQDFSLRTISGALSAMDMLDETLSALSSQRGVLGAYQSRLTIAANTLLAQTEQFRSAESRIRDADMAQEAAELSRVQILQQAGASVLAQANNQPQLALTLLRT